MPRLRRTDAHHRDLPARADTANPSATKKAGRMMKSTSYARPPTRHSSRRSKGGFGSLLFRRRKGMLTSAARPKNVPDRMQKAGKPSFRTRQTLQNSNQYQRQRPVLSHSTAHASPQLPPCQICQRGTPAKTNLTDWPASKNLRQIDQCCVTHERQLFG